MLIELVRRFPPLLAPIVMKYDYVLQDSTYIIDRYVYLLQMQICCCIANYITKPKL
jgi:hypothetical protein